jgi:hypothetical protein
MELQAELGALAAIILAWATLWRFLDRHGLIWKKTAHVSKQNRPDVAQERQRWCAEQARLGSSHLLFIDQTWAPNQHGASVWPLAQRSAAAYQHPARTLQNQYLWAGLRLSGMMAPLVLDEPINTASLQTYVDKFLCHNWEATTSW